MEQIQNFRSAFNGFNREDVVHYLDYLNKKHAAQISQLNGDAEDLRRRLEAVDPQELEELKSRCEDQQMLLEAAELEKEDLTARLEQLEKEKADLAARVAVLEAENAQLQTRPVQEEPKPEAAALMSHSATQELEAYRRAERMERMAKERAEQVYQQTNSILADATVKVDGAAAQINTVTDQVMAQLNLLQCAVNSSRLALQEAAATLYGLQPGNQE